MIRFTEPFCFHIGYHRTGTTFVQRFILPQCSGAAASLPPDDVARAVKQLLLEGRAFSDRELTALRGCLDRSAGPLFISGEALSGNMFNDDFAMPERIERFFPNSRIIVTIRSQYTAIPSMYQYLYIKSGGTGSYGAFVRRLTDDAKWRYLELVTLYRERFGGQAVKTLLFEDLQRDQDGFLHDFLDFAGIPPTYNASGGRQHRNSRPHVLEARFGRFTNRLFADGSLISRMAGSTRLSAARGSSRKLLRALGSFGERTLPMKPRGFEDDPACRSLIASHYAEGNRKLAKMLNLDLSGYPL